METVRARLHGGGGPQVGEVTRLAVVEKWPAFTCKLTTPGSRGDVTRRCCVAATHVKRENGGQTTHFGGQCSFPLIICSRCYISVLWLFTVTFDDTKPPPKSLWIRAHLWYEAIFLFLEPITPPSWLTLAPIHAHVVGSRIDVVTLHDQIVSVARFAHFSQRWL